MPAVVRRKDSAVRCRATGDDNEVLSEADSYIPNFVLEGETFRTVSAGAVTLYLWEPAFAIGSSLCNYLVSCAGLLGLSVLAAQVGVEVRSGEALVVSVFAGWELS